MVSLKDIAEKAGVSVSQVSRALNDYPDVKAENRDKIKKIADDMGYVKNLNAKYLSSKQSFQMALILNGINSNKNSDDAIAFQIMKGFNQYAKENSIDISIFLTEDGTDSYERYCKERAASGVVLYGVNYDDPALKKIEDSDFSCVTIDIPFEGRNKGCILVNNIYYSKMATAELIKHGRKNIWMLAGHKHAMVTIERKSGFEMALQEMGDKNPENHVLDCDFSSELAYKKIIELLKTKEKIDGLFCANDFMALGALKAIEEFGYTVPNDISIIGFDGISLVNYTTPKLATIEQNNIRKGYMAAKLLSEIVQKNKMHERTIMVPCKLLQNESISDGE